MTDDRAAEPRAVTGAMPGAVSGAMPGAVSGAMPGAVSRATPGAVSRATPGAVTGAGTGVRFPSATLRAVRLVAAGLWRSGRASCMQHPDGATAWRPRQKRKTRRWRVLQKPARTDYASPVRSGGRSAYLNECLRKSMPLQCLVINTYRRHSPHIGDHRRACTRSPHAPRPAILPRQVGTAPRPASMPPVPTDGHCSAPLRRPDGFGPLNAGRQPDPQGSRPQIPANAFANPGVITMFPARGV